MIGLFPPRQNAPPSKLPLLSVYSLFGFVSCMSLHGWCHFLGDLDCIHQAEGESKLLECMKSRKPPSERQVELGKRYRKLDLNYTERREEILLATHILESARCTRSKERKDPMSSAGLATRRQEVPLINQTRYASKAALAGRKPILGVMELDFCVFQMQW